MVQQERTKLIKEHIIILCCSLYLFKSLNMNLIFCSYLFSITSIKRMWWICISFYKNTSLINSKSIFLAQIPMFVILFYIFERLTRLVYCVGVFTNFWIFLNSLCFASASNLKITFSEVAMWHPISLILYENYID